jgi:8-amino-7-oxononanoate synthase
MRPAEIMAREELSRLERQGLLRHLDELQTPQGPVVTLGGQSLFNFSSNDYLGLAHHPALEAAVARRVGQVGTGAGASRLVVGNLEIHRELEQRLARLEGAEAAVVFTSGYAANVGAVSSLVGPGDVILSDALNHASLIDGARLSRARVVIYPHGDVEALALALGEAPEPRKLVITDAVFSMDGDLAPLRELADLVDRAGAMLLVDEAHATGLMGSHGGGLTQALSLEDRVDVRVGTLSKALGGMGGFAAGSRAMAELIINRARSLVFSTGIAPTACASALAALDVIEVSTALRERLWSHVHAFSKGLRQLGVSAEPRSPIFPVILGDPSTALAASEALRERGVLVKAIRPPTVPAGTSRLRFSVSAAHEPAHIEAALAALHAVLARLPGRLQTTPDAA